MGETYADTAADFVMNDRWSSLTDRDLERIINSSEGALRREASKIIADREAAEKAKQDALEAVPGFGSF